MCVSALECSAQQQANCFIDMIKAKPEGLSFMELAMKLQPENSKSEEYVNLVCEIINSNVDIELKSQPGKPRTYVMKSYCQKDDDCLDPEKIKLNDIHFCTACKEKFISATQLTKHMKKHDYTCVDKVHLRRIVSFDRINSTISFFVFASSDTSALSSFSSMPNSEDCQLCQEKVEDVNGSRWHALRRLFSDESSTTTQILNLIVTLLDPLPQGVKPFNYKGKLLEFFDSRKMNRKSSVAFNTIRIKDSNTQSLYQFGCTLTLLNYEKANAIKKAVPLVHFEGFGSDKLSAEQMASCLALQHCLQILASPEEVNDVGDCCFSESVVVKNCSNCSCPLYTLMQTSFTGCSFLS